MKDKRAQWKRLECNVCVDRGKQNAFIKIALGWKGVVTMGNTSKDNEQKDVSGAWWVIKFAREMMEEASRLAELQGSKWVFLYWL